MSSKKRTRSDTRRRFTRFRTSTTRLMPLFVLRLAPRPCRRSVSNLKDQPAPALYIVVLWDSQAASDAVFYKRSEAQEYCDRMYGPLGRVVEYLPNDK